ncbi:hypothetical protein Airi01_078210 [Actinoallomurus iriomotensis]|uniref:Uncharacterized protein n=1 Tax=Actinoallomurus iriomotensis TaxID=478107 RepID=A0A9W6VTW9_9ACTN|nr:hypothetical protein Airi01_078210 [Actinoallomurus iriomotensis]
MVGARITPGRTRHGLEPAGRRSVVDAFTRARHAAAQEEAPALRALRGQGVDIDALRRVLP